MTNAAEKFLERFGSNITQSIGVRSTPPVPPEGLASSPPTKTDPMTGRTRARSLGVLDIRNVSPDPGQPRKEFSEESLERLSESLKKFGQLMPIRVRWDQAIAKWVIISGERRYRAALKAGLNSVTCHFVEEALPGTRVLEEQVVENCQREGLTPIEQATAYRVLMDTNGWSTRRVADELGLTSGTVTKALSLLKLPEDVRRMVDSGELPATVGYELSKLDGDDTRRSAANVITGSKLPRDEAVALVKRTGRKAENEPERNGAGLTCPSAEIPSPVPQSVSVVDKSAQRIEDRTVLRYSLSNGVTITISSPDGGASTDVVGALERVLNAVQDETTQWGKKAPSPTLMGR